jgi:hypothetical protein
MSQVLGAFGLMDFTMSLRPVLTWRILKLIDRLFLKFSKFFAGRGKPRTLNPRVRGPPVLIFFSFLILMVICFGLFDHHPAILQKLKILGVQSCSMGSHNT